MKRVSDCDTEGRSGAKCISGNAELGHASAVVTVFEEFVREIGSQSICRWGACDYTDPYFAPSVAEVFNRTMTYGSWTRQDAPTRACGASDSI